MKTINSFCNLIDELFGDLEEASWIAVELDPRILTNPEKMDDARIVKSVNSQTSARHYLDFMKRISSEALENLIEILHDIAPAEMDSFFELLKRRCRQFLRTVTVTKTLGTEVSMVKNVTWAPEYVFFMCNGEEIDLSLAGCKGVLQTRRHALIYFLIMKNLDDRVSAIADSAFMLNFSQKPTPAREIHIKFRLSCTVAFLGGLLRVICDRNIIENPNVAELCRRIAPSFYTERQENISPKSLRNSYDDPNSEILTQILQELKLWIRYIDRKSVV